MNSKPRLWTWPFITICLAHFILTFAFYASMPVFPDFLQTEFALSGIVLGVITASYTAAAITFRPPTGYWLDRFGRRIVYLPAYGLFALVYYLYPLAESELAIGAARLLHGALWGVAMGAAGTTSVDLMPPERRGEGVGVFGLGMIFSMAAGPTVSLMIVESMGFDYLFTMSARLTLAGFFLLCLLPFPPIPRRVQPFTPASLFERSSLPAALATVIYCIPYGTLMNFTSIYAKNISGGTAGGFFFCFAAGTASTRFFSGKMFDTRGPRSVMPFAYGLLFTGCVLLALAWEKTIFYGAGVCLGMGYGIAFPILNAMVNTLVPPQRRGAANATTMTAFDLGICLGLLLTSALSDLLGWHITYALLAGCMACSCLVFYRITLPAYETAQIRGTKAPI